MADITVNVYTGTFTVGEPAWGAEVLIKSSRISSLLGIFTAEGTIEQGWVETLGESLWGNLQPEVAIVSGITLTIYRNT